MVMQSLFSRRHSEHSRKEMPDSYSQLGEPFPLSQKVSTFNEGTSGNGNLKVSYDPSHSSGILNKQDVVFIREGIW